jgi:hypothetical protein
LAGGQFSSLNYFIVKKMLRFLMVFALVGFAASSSQAGTFCIKGQTKNTKKCTKGTENDRCEGAGSDCGGMSQTKV